MDVNSHLNISELSSELNAGEIIIKFIIKRFQKWIGVVDNSGQIIINKDTLTTIIIILDKINNGVLPSIIENELKNNRKQTQNLNESPLTQSDINIQTRIALALEQRNEIEIQKTKALNNIADAISNSQTLPELQSHSRQDSNKPIIDDLSSLIDTTDIPPKADTPLKKDIDDLSLLIKNIDNIQNFTDITPEIDDLSQLIENKEPEKLEIDDLSLLTNIESDEAIIDDLSMLLDNNIPSDTDDKAIDDLSSLIDKPDTKKNEIDDLSSLVDFKPKKKYAVSKPEFSPKDDFEKYKSEIINIIIDLKNKGVTEEKTHEIFNKEGILTFSGKSKWTIKTISQIYQLIDNAA